jgi:hypothetical protein
MLPSAAVERLPVETTTDNTAIEKLSGAFGNLFRSPDNIARYDNLDGGESPEPPTVPTDSGGSGGDTPVTITYAPQIRVDGSGMDESALRALIEELLASHKPELVQLILDTLAKIRSREERLANA